MAPTLDMRANSVHARQDLAYLMQSRGLPPELIMVECGFATRSSVYRAIASGAERAKSNEGRISDRMFGVEIEFNQTSRSEVVEWLQSHSQVVNASVQNYNHEVQLQWKLITDSSVSGAGVDCSNEQSCDCDYDDCDHDEDLYEGCGLEAVSPILKGKNGFQQVADMVRAIKETGGAVDRTCGLHVHHDARDMSPEAIAYMLDLYLSNQSEIDSMLAPSRRASANNQWCQGYDAQEREGLVQAAKDRRNFSYWNRYKTVNVTSYPKYGSIEFRQHQGTLNLQKIENWVRFGQAIVEASIKHADEKAFKAEDLQDLLSWLVKEGGLRESTKKYLLGRADSYQGRRLPVAD